jgi:hypothetical protein
VNPLELIYEAGALCIDALLVLGSIFRDPRRAAEYCRKCGLPPLEIETDWVPRAQELREQLELENAAQTMSLVLVVIDELRGAVAAGADGWQMQLADVLRRLLVGAMLVVLYRNRRKKYSFTLFTIVFVLVLVDTRLQEALSTTLAHERWIALLRGMIDEGRVGNDRLLAAGDEPARRRLAAVLGAPVAADGAARAAAALRRASRLRSASQPGATCAVRAARPGERCSAAPLQSIRRCRWAPPPASWSPTTSRCERRSSGATAWWSLAAGSCASTSAVAAWCGSRAPRIRAAASAALAAPSTSCADQY